MSMDTVSQVLARLAADGYDQDFRRESGGFRCAPCGHWHDASAVAIDEIVRFEGASDPDDEAVVFALRCDQCAAKGTFVAAYGPAMSPEDADIVRRLQDRRS